MNIIITGSLAFDLIMDYQGRFADQIMPDKIHKINLSFLLSDLKKQQGGTAGNIAYTLSLLRNEVSILSCAGNDFDEYKQFLSRSGVDVSNIKIEENMQSATAYIMTDKVDNQLTGFYPGAMSKSPSLSLSKIKNKPSYVAITPDDPVAIEKFSNEARELKIPFMIDMGMQLPSLSGDKVKKILIAADILIGNDYEIELLKEKSKISEGELLNQVKILITTLGGKGSLIQTQKQKIEIAPAKPEVVLDPTGAGDAYRAGFLAGYLRDLDLKTCGQMGSIASCYAIEKYGTTNHKFSIDEFKIRYKENFDENLDGKI